MPWERNNSFYHSISRDRTRELYLPPFKLRIKGKLIQYNNMTGDERNTRIARNSNDKSREGNTQSPKLETIHSLITAKRTYLRKPAAGSSFKGNESTCLHFIFLIFFSTTKKGNNVLALILIILYM